ncbi:glycosyltransferase [Alkalihalobacillus sp. 1P02AB]|uniref:glycosyltransferase n=1 Tax=Alkalihalobacillus sp. 1P02AB TaxID=3132260 RepID=UPI0039A69686
MKNNIKMECQKNVSQSVNAPLLLLQGTIEIANQMYTLSKGLSHTEVIPSTLNYYPSYLNYSSEFEIEGGTWKDFNKIDLLKEHIQNTIIPSFDIFHFHFSTSLMPDYSDLNIINHHKKPILMNHWGSDVRDLNKALEINPYAKAKVKNSTYIERTLKKLSQHIRYCIVADHELLRYVEDYYEHTFMLPTSVDLSNYQVLDQKNKKPLIVHAPTNYEVKGSPYIINAITKLQSEFEFDFQLITGTSHEEAKRIYQQADLIIDQLHIGSYGLFAVECMALGKPVICHISDYMKEHYPQELPIISANPDTIYETIRELLKNQDQLKELAKCSRQYANLYHDHLKNSCKLLDIYKKILIQND